MNYTSLSISLPETKITLFSAFSTPSAIQPELQTLSQLQFELFLFDWSALQAVSWRDVPLELFHCYYCMVVLLSVAVHMRRAKKKKEAAHHSLSPTNLLSQNQQSPPYFSGSEPGGSDVFFSSFLTPSRPLPHVRPIHRWPLSLGRSVGRSYIARP